jgi:hypothetical protein
MEILWLRRILQLLPMSFSVAVGQKRSNGVGFILLVLMSMEGLDKGPAVILRWTPTIGPKSKKFTLSFSV